MRNLLGRVLVSAVVLLVAQHGGAADLVVGLRGGFLSDKLNASHLPDDTNGMPLVGAEMGVAVGGHWVVTTMLLWGRQEGDFRKLGEQESWDGSGRTVYAPLGSGVYERAIVSVGGRYSVGSQAKPPVRPFLSVGLGVASDTYGYDYTRTGWGESNRVAARFGGGIELKAVGALSLFLSGECFADLSSVEGPFWHGGILLRLPCGKGVPEN